MPLLSYTVVTLATLQGIAFGFALTGAALMACQARARRGR